MKKKELLEIYICDCCGKKMIDQPSYLLEGCNRGSSGVTFEPSVMGDYCDSCLEFAQDDWDINNKDGFISEKNDKFDEDIWKKEVELMKNAKYEYDEDIEYGRLYR